MTDADYRLLRQLIIAVLIKFIFLTSIWWLFVRDTRVSVDAERVADRISTTLSSQGAVK